MNYEEKYKELLECAKILQSPEYADASRDEILERLFPELSKDKKVIEKVINVLKLNIKDAESKMQNSRGVDRTFEIYACNKVITWLEKQNLKNEEL